MSTHNITTNIRVIYLEDLIYKAEMVMLPPYIFYGQFPVHNSSLIDTKTSEQEEKHMWFSLQKKLID